MTELPKISELMKLRQDTLYYFLRDRIGWIQAQIYNMHLRNEVPQGISVPPYFLGAPRADETELLNPTFLDLPVHRHEIASPPGLEDEIRIFSEHSTASLVTSIVEKNRNYA